MLRESAGSGEHDGIKICRVRQVLEVLDAEQVGRKNKRAIENKYRKNPPRQPKLGENRNKPDVVRSDLWKPGTENCGKI